MEIIERVKSLSKKYPDFREEMERFFSNRTNTNVDSDNKISKIVEYLGLDVYVDNMDSINYNIDNMWMNHIPVQ